MANRRVRKKRLCAKHERKRAHQRLPEPGVALHAAPLRRAFAGSDARGAQRSCPPSVLLFNPDDDNPSTTSARNSEHPLFRKKEKRETGLYTESGQSSEGLISAVSKPVLATKIQTLVGRKDLAALENGKLLPRSSKTT